jgi:predicted oxidoreductase
MKCSKILMCQDGPNLSRIVAGMWRMGEWRMSVSQRLQLIEQCIALGVTTFDHADIYGSGEVELLFGEALASKSELKHQIQIVTKCGIQLPSKVDGVARVKHYNMSNQHIHYSVENSLKKLGVEKIDLLLLHRPSPLMDFDEIAETLYQLMASGKVLHFGVSNFSTRQFEALNKRIPLATNQVEFSPFNLSAMEDGLFDGLQDMKISPMIWSALGGQDIYGAIRKAQRVNKAFTDAGNKMGLTTSGAVYSWIMQLPCKPLF